MRETLSGENPEFQRSELISKLETICAGEEAKTIVTRLGEVVVWCGREQQAEYGKQVRITFYFNSSKFFVRVSALDAGFDPKYQPYMIDTYAEELPSPLRQLQSESDQHVYELLENVAFDPEDTLHFSDALAIAINESGGMGYLPDVPPWPDEELE